MKKILSLLLFVALAWASMAQIMDPVKWTFQVKDLNENESELVFTAQLDEGWHLYSQHTDPNGPFGISFQFTPSKDYALKGKVSEPKPHEEFDKDFNCTVRSFSGRVVFRQKIERLSAKDFKVKGTYSYQLCNNGSCIAPEDRDFTFNVKGAQHPNDATAKNEEPVADTATEVLQENEATIDTATPAVTESNSDTKPEGKQQSLIVVFLLAVHVEP